MSYTSEEQAANRAALVEALRSGKYKQGKEQLRPSEDEYCCLGVACDISGLGNWNANLSERRYIIEAVQWSTFTLPPLVQDWLGFDSALGDMNENDTLSAMNDAGSTFNEIADIIEAGRVMLQ